MRSALILDGWSNKCQTQNKLAKSKFRNPPINSFLTHFQAQAAHLALATHLFLSVLLKNIRHKNRSVLPRSSGLVWSVDVFSSRVGG